MSKLIKAFYFATLMTCLDLHAAKYLLIAGGGGEALQDSNGKAITDTIFDRELKNVSDYKKSNPQIKTKVMFNGGHSDTEKIVSENFTKKEIASTEFNSADFKKYIKNLEWKIRNNKIKKGDQVLLYLSSHGAENQNGEKTHSIAVSGKETVNDFEKLNSNIISLDALTNLTRLARRKGIKLGIIDFSCHSGNTIKLRNPNTCVITSTGPNHFAYPSTNGSDFPSRFSANMKSGKSLEEIYLASREGFNDASFPMISSPVGIDVQNDLYNKVSDYLQNFDFGSSKLATTILNKTSQANICDDESSFNSLITQIDELKNAVSEEAFSSSTFEKLKSDLKEYHKYIHDIKATLLSNGFEGLNRREKICPTNSYKFKSRVATNCLEYSQRDIMMMNYDESIKFMKNQRILNDEVLNDDLSMQVEVLEKFRKRSEELKSQFPNIKSAKEILDDLPRKEEITMRLAREIAVGLQTVYKNRYQLKMAGDKRKNPCKNFVL
ncbi:MAG: caspase family protein [Bacteriovoracaceae bacterium]